MAIDIEELKAAVNRYICTLDGYDDDGNGSTQVRALPLFAGFITYMQPSVSADELQVAKDRIAGLERTLGDADPDQ